MMTTRMTALKERAEAAVTKARELAQRAADENRKMTAAEQSTYDAAMKDLVEILDTVKTVKADEDILDQAKAFGAGVGTPGAPMSFKDSGQRLSFKGMGSQIASKVQPEGSKALVPSGGISTVVSQGFTAGPIALGRPGTSLLDALPVEVRPSPIWKYLRQTVRTNNAAVVSEGAVKPTSVYSVAEVDGALSVVAHLSEAIPRYYFVDNRSLEDFVATELEYGLRLAVEAKAIADVNGTSGIQLQAFATDVLTTLRKSVTKLETVDSAPAFFVLHPTDWEGVDLLKDGEDRYYFGGPQTMGTRTLWDIPVVVSLAQTAGIAHAIAVDSVGVDTDTSGVGVQWSEESNSDDFSRNLLRARCEGRFGTSVFRPFGVVKATLTA